MNEQRTSYLPPLTSGMAVTGLILSFVAPFFGLIVSTLAFRDINSGTRRGRGIASWGFGLSLIGVLAPAALVVAIIVGAVVNPLPKLVPWATPVPAATAPAIG